MASVSLPDSRFTYHTKPSPEWSSIQSERSASATVISPDLGLSGTAGKPRSRPVKRGLTLLRGLTPERAFPYRQHAPVHRLERGPGGPVAFDVRADLRAPELGPRFGPAEKWAVVPVPETAVHEDHRAVAAPRGGSRCTSPQPNRGSGKMQSWETGKLENRKTERMKSWER